MSNGTELLVELLLADIKRCHNPLIEKSMRQYISVDTEQLQIILMDWLHLRSVVDNVERSTESMRNSIKLMKESENAELVKAKDAIAKLQSKLDVYIDGEEVYVRILNENATTIGALNNRLAIAMKESRPHRPMEDYTPEELNAHIKDIMTRYSKIMKYLAEH